LLGIIDFFHNRTQNLEKFEMVKTDEKTKADSFLSCRNTEFSTISIFRTETDDYGISNRKDLPSRSISIIIFYTA